MSNGNCIWPPWLSDFIKLDLSGERFTTFTMFSFKAVRVQEGRKKLNNETLFYDIWCESRTMFFSQSSRRKSLKSLNVKPSKYSWYEKSRVLHISAFGSFNGWISGYHNILQQHVIEAISHLYRAKHSNPACRVCTPSPERFSFK